MKTKLRKHFKSLRDNMNEDLRATLGGRAQELFLSSGLYESATNIMLYIPLGNEVATENIISQCIADSKTVLLPVTDRQTCSMDAVIYTPDSVMKKGAFSVSEPQDAVIFDKNKIDLVIVPGIAFSQKGGRIGFGKGCYDRFLQGIPAKKVGLCYEFQLSGRIKCDSNDEEMDYIITEERVIDCAEQKKLMKANYHTHTYHCHHATGTPREYVETAIRNGLEILGFSDHNPCPFSNGFTSDYRVDLDDTGTYINELLSLRGEFWHKIEILIGYEAEYYPKEHENILSFIRHYECDYMILGQHFTNNGYDGAYSGRYTEDENVLKDYVNQVIDGINTGLFSYIAHPDLINYRKDTEIYTLEITRLLEEAKRLSIPVEFNLLGFEENRAYPYDEFWKLVKKVGNDVVIGCDAHRPGAVANPEIYLSARKKLETFGITPIDYITLKKV